MLMIGNCFFDIGPLDLQKSIGHTHGTEDLLGYEFARGDGLTS